MKIGFSQVSIIRKNCLMCLFAIVCGFRVTVSRRKRLLIMWNLVLIPINPVDFIFRRPAVLMEWSV